MRARRCEVYGGGCQVDDPRSDLVPPRPLAVAEVVTVYRDGKVGIGRYCVKCLHVLRGYRGSVRAHNRRGISHGPWRNDIVRSERVTWLTTLVDGEVLA